MSIGDVNSEAKGTGARFNDGKVAMKYTPLHLLDGVNRVWAIGAKKYKDWNWAKGMPWSVPYECALRHLSAWYRGEVNDPETGEAHLDHAMCNLLMLIHYAQAYKEGDDRPTMFTKPVSLPPYMNDSAKWFIKDPVAYFGTSAIVEPVTDIVETQIKIGDRVRLNLEEETFCIDDREPLSPGVYWGKVISIYQDRQTVRVGCSTWTVDVYPSVITVENHPELKCE